MEDTRTEAEAAAITRVAQQAVDPHIELIGDPNNPLEVRLYGAQPGGGVGLIETVDLEQFQTGPACKRGHIRVATPESLGVYAARHLDPARSTLWAEIDEGRLTVVLNDHADFEGSADAGWGDHRVTMQFARSPEWKAWAAIDGKLLEQTELARFLEENLTHVVSPDGSTLLEVTQTFHATQGVTFKQSQSLHSGEQRLVWEEDLTATAGLGKHTEIPTDLVVRLRPWLGTEALDIEAKFRFRIQQGQLRLAVELLRTEERSRDAVERAADQVAEELGLTAIWGTPPSPLR